MAIPVVGQGGHPLSRLDAEGIETVHELLSSPGEVTEGVPVHLAVRRATHDFGLMVVTPGRREEQPGRQRHIHHQRILLGRTSTLEY